MNLTTLEQTRPDLGKRSLAQQDLIAFTRHLYPQYRPGRHHFVIADVLGAVEQERLNRVLLTIPPRHGKSELGSVHFPPYYLGRNPDKRIIAGSYGASLAYQFSRRARNIVGHPLYPFEIATAGDLSNVQRWDIADHRGGYLAAGVGGSIAGHGANLLLIDDPVGSAEQADSPTYRDRAWNWYTQDALTRLEPDGAVVVIGTRWHQDDLIGRILENEGDQWHHIDMPALDDQGRALWPERFSAQMLEERREVIGLRAFTALYQQRPSPDKGAILKREYWQLWPGTVLGRPEWVVQCWDTAFKTGQTSDYSACATLALLNGNFYLIDMYREKLEFPELKRQVRTQYLRFKPDEIVIEDAASGQSLIQELARNTTPETTWSSGIPLPVVPFRPDPSKIARVHAISPYVEGHRVYLPADASWSEAFIEEANAFPTGAHDDMVDAFTIAMLRMVRWAHDALMPGDPDALGFLDYA